ncbi:MAG: FIVAR domain-containing protein, partial [Bacteroidaceae bacterium]|nr:FIVAR domain-containing protein [Bacteroidaceae bacterium]
MMKRRFLFAVMTLIAAVWSLSASAQEDVTSTYLTNADFSSGTVQAGKVYGYGHDGTPWGLQAAEGWTIEVLNGDADNGHENSGMAGGIFPYGSTTAMLQGGGKTPPAAGPDGSEGNCLGFLGVWSCGGYYYQEVTLPAGEYTLQFPIYNQQGTQANTSWTGFVADNGTKYTCAINTAIGEWTTQTVTFALTAETKGKVCVGYLSTGSGSAANPHIFYDGVTMLFKANETVIKDELSAMITDATNFNNIVNDADLTSAIADAQAVFDDDDATQEEVNTATSDLELALTQANTSHDRTYLITNPDFTDNISGWTSTTGAQNNTRASNQPFPNNPFWENWNGSAYTGKMYQKLTGLAEGRYALTIWAFVNNFDAEAQHVYGNNVQVSLTAGAPTQYLVSPISVIDGTLEIGLEQTTAVANWMGIDEARLYYIGPLTAEDYKDGLITLISEAQALTDPNEASASALASAISAAEGVANDPSATIDDVKAAVESLGAAIDHSKGSIAAEETLMAMKAFTETTNFYTPEAYETYYGQWQAKYDAGELTETEALGLQNPNVGTDWRPTNIIVDDLLMSVWDEEPLMWDSYHVNTWSTEGDNDGTNFRIPFIEYWTGNGNSLA